MHQVILNDGRRVNYFVESNLIFFSSDEDGVVSPSRSQHSSAKGSRSASSLTTRSIRLICSTLDFDCPIGIASGYAVELLLYQPALT